MNALPDRPAMPPLPPPDGAFGRVQRRAFLRKMRVPAAGAVGAAIVVGALTVAPVPQASDRLQVTTQPSESPTAEPAPSPSAPPPPPPPPPPPTTPSATVTPSYRPAPPVSSPDRTDEILEDIETWAPEDLTYTDDQICRKGAPGRYGPDVTGVVVDQRGKPVPDITISASACANGYYATAQDVAHTDAQGRFSFTCLKGWAMAAPFQWYYGDVSTTAPVGFAFFGGKQFASIECGKDYRLVLPDAGTVRVTFVGKEGETRPEQLSAGIGTAADEVTSFLGRDADGNGVVALAGLSPGRLWLSAGHPGNATITWVHVRAGETLELRLGYDGKAADSEPSTSPSQAPTATPSAMTAE